MAIDEQTYGRAADTLVSRAASGDADAFDALIASRLDGLYHTAVAILRHDADARDAVQDTCVQAWREMRRLRAAERFDAWLGRILVNSCRDQLRSRRRSTVREIAVQDLGAREPATAASGVPDRLAEVDSVRRAFLRLKPDDRILLGLHHGEHVAVDSIAELMSIPSGTVKWRLHEARKSLAKALEREG